MKRLTKKELGKISLLVRKGKSLKHISNEIGKSKTTIYHHFRKLKGRTFHPVKVNALDDELVGEFIGLFAGDGYSDTTKNFQHRTYLFFNMNEERFVQDLIKNVLIPLFGKPPMLFKRRDDLIILCYYSKEIHKLISKYLVWEKKAKKTYSVRLKKQNLSQKFHKGFIRGSLDSDGHFSKQKINFASVSSRLMNNVSESLSQFNIPHSRATYIDKRPNRKPVHHIDVRKKNRQKFIPLIKPRNIK